MFDGLTDGARLPIVAANATAAPCVIRAEVLRHLLTAADWPVGPKGVRLRRVMISGLLDLAGATVRCPLVLEDCDLDDSRFLVLDYATIPFLALTRCRLAGFSGDSLAIGGNLNLSGSAFAGQVVLAGARIDGALLCWGASLGKNSYGTSLLGQGMTVRLSVHLRGGFTSNGGIILSRADIGGELICRGAALGANESGSSLHAPGIKVGGAVYLSEGFSAQGSVGFARAAIGGEFRCDGAHLGADREGNSLACDGMRAGGSVHLDAVPGGSAFVTDGAVRLAGADITGSVTCRGGQLGVNHHGNALIADELRASVAVLLEDGLDVAGAVRLPGAQIGGQLRCGPVQINGADRDGFSLVAEGIKVGGPAYLSGEFRSAGAVVLSGAEFGGLLSLAGARIGAGPGQCALAADGIRVSRDMLLSEAICGGSIKLAGAAIGGSLTCDRAQLGADQTQNSLAAGKLAVGGDVTLDSLTAAGALIMAGAVIGGLLGCWGARLAANIYGNALNAAGIKVSRDVFLGNENERFTASGTVRLAGADITGSLHCQGARIVSDNPAHAALAADGIRVGGSAYLSAQFTAGGEVRLSQAVIGGSLTCGSASLSAGPGYYALLAEQVSVAGGVLLHEGFTAEGLVSLRGASIGRELRWEPGEPFSGEVNLEGAHAQYLTDDWSGPRRLGFWPAGRLRLAGFTYSGFGGRSQATVDQRLEWIRNQYDARLPPSSDSASFVPGTDTAADGEAPPEGNSQRPVGTTAVLPFATQPYRQLSDVYRRAGQEDESRSVEIAMRRDIRKYGNLTRQRKALNWILDFTIRYGFQTGRALAGILVLYAIVFLAFLAAQHQGALIIASNITNPRLHPTALRCVTGYPCFYPAGYAFDVVVPLINIHQADFWQTNGHHYFGWAWVLGTWIATALGWFLATLLVVGYSGLARRE